MSEVHKEGIAIISLSGRFPGAATVDEFWSNLANGRESITTFSEEELAAAGLSLETIRGNPDYVRARGVLAGAAAFDAGFFGMNPIEAEVTDPQQRLFLEASWQALETAGYDPARFSGAVGVFAGMSNNTYYLHNLNGRRDLVERAGWLTTMMGNEKDYLATRVAYKLNLRGPAVSLYTACSTSLVAVCQACQSLLNYACDLALAGGVSVTFPQERGYLYQEGGIISPDGCCRPFDAGAAGTVFSHGLGVVVLKRLDEALADGDNVLAVIKGSALNNDGSGKVSYTAPSVDGQAEVVALAQALAGFDPDSITLLEAHGTATPLGDPIEVAALTLAFRRGTGRKNFCALGSVKSNIGHLDVAAGVTGLIKAVLSLTNRKIPPSLHFTRPNPKLELEESPFYVNTRLSDWDRGGEPLRAGVSSFGVGGTNAHVVLEEAPAAAQAGPSRPWQLLLLSAKTEAALATATANLAAHLNATPEVSLADVAHTLQVGRAEFRHRRAAVCQSREGAVDVLEALDSKRLFTAAQERKDPPVVFMFPGQGAQHVNMGKELYRTERVFRDEVDGCAEILKPHLGLDLRSVLYPEPGREESAEQELIQTRITQPAIFVVEYALAKLWMAWGIKPAAMIGHSVGEYVAATLADVFQVDTALEVVAARARLVQEQPGGAMLAVRLPEREVEPLLDGRLSIAAVNAPSLCVVSGPEEAIAKLEGRLAEKGIAGKRLHTSHAFHSAMMDPVVEPFTRLLEKVRFHAPTIPCISNVTAQWMTPEQATDPRYWAGHVRQAVRFADGVGVLLEDLDRVLLEVGPGVTLSALARQHPSRKPAQTILASLSPSREPDQELPSLLVTLGRLWLSGVTIDWNGFYEAERRRRVPLPTYPFERKRYYAEPRGQGAQEIIPWASPPSGLVINSAGAASAPPAIRPAGETVSTEGAQAPSESAPARTRRERLVEALTLQLQELSGLDAAVLNPAASFLEMGFDSLFLTQASLAFQQRFGVRITFRQLLEEHSSVNDLAAHLDETLPAGVLEPEPELPSTAGVPLASDSPRGAGQADSMGEETETLARQSELRREAGLSGAEVGHPVAKTGHVVEGADGSGGSMAFGPFKPIERGAGGGLTVRQRRHLDELIERYGRRTAGSKLWTQQHRRHLADPRAVAGFRQSLKEITYPIVSVRSAGARLWDIDDNEYIDVTLGFGMALLGHRPPFVTEAVERQLRTGFEIGPSTPLAGEVAAMICEFSGQKRATFSNTGSEAVLAALRVARTVTGRNHIALFAGSYHGIFDEVLVRTQTGAGEWRSFPAAPGIPPSMVENVLVLEYGNPKSLDILRREAGRLAAVLVEPVQSRRPDLQPGEFLRELRQITDQSGAALVFDEIVTGFRCHPGGAQAVFGVRADLVTYGKVVGGGLPIGVLAGRRRFMDALDGGAWSYGDDTFPEAGVTFFAGTFVRHPLALAAARAVLEHLKEQGPALQHVLDERTTAMTDELNRHFESIQVPVRLTRFSSMYYVNMPPEIKWGALLFHHLREKGIHIWEGRPSFLSTAHSAEDIRRIIVAFKEGVAEMQAGGFLPETPASPAEPPPGPSGALVPLTESQREIWLAAQLGTDAVRAFTNMVVIHMRGDLDAALLQQTLQSLVDRHDALRATFAADGSGQTFLAELRVELPPADLSGEPGADRERRLEERIVEEDQKPFDLENGPLFRSTLVRMDPQHHVLLLATHHIVTDGWSVGVLLHELSRLYTSRRRGLAYQLDPAMQYHEFALWHQTEEHAATAGEAEAYWMGQYSRLPEPLDLPADRPRPPVKTYRASRESLTLDSEFYHRLKEASARQGTTLFSYLLAGFLAFLHRLTGQEDLVVGIPAAGQIAEGGLMARGSKALVGHCVNMLPVRGWCSGELSFAEVLASVKCQMLDAYEHQNHTFGRLVRKLNLPRDAGRVPLVPLAFNVDRAFSGFHLEGVESEIVYPVKGFNFFDLSVNVVDLDRELRVDCRYNTDMFARETIRRWLRHWRSLLEASVGDPNRPVAELPVLTPVELKQLVSGWNDTRMDFPHDSRLSELFEAQAARCPDAVAVEFEGEELSYGELNQRANRLAHHLRGLGVGPETLVGLCVERSFEMVVGILGVLKAGGAYVPLDPAYPPERLEFMVRDTAAPLVLSQSRFRSALPAAARVVGLDDDWPEIARAGDANPPPVGDARNLAYVIYTSGSTGQPKGVLVEHRSIVNHLTWRQSEFPLTPDDRFLQKASFSFDISVWEIFSPLLAGARLVLARPGGQMDSAYLARIMTEREITVAHFGPAMLELVLAEPEWKRCTRLRRVFCGGEPMPVDLPGRFSARSGAELVNQYGPTEATVDATFFRCNGAITSGTVPIGRPVANTQVYVLDRELNPVPVGVAGELHIGGVSVARGYLNRPELTAEKFISDPFTGAAGGRLYKTGDRARWLGDGTIEFLGRNDDQVKIRGFRVELGEIEMVLAGNPALRECAVVAREDRPGDKLVVAYVVGKRGNPDTDELRAFLRRKLPDYMMPSVFVPMEALPRTTSGKTDRRALPVPDIARLAGGGAFVAPRSPEEEVLANIWKAVLHLETVGVRNNFFELGGHSLLATQVITRVREAFKVELPLGTFLKLPTIEGLASAVEELLIEEIRGLPDDEVARLTGTVE